MHTEDDNMEQVLVRRAKRGDVKAFSRLYAGIYKDLYRFALYTTRHPQDAEDAVSETILSGYEHIKSLKKEESFRSWMFTILNRNCLRLMRKNTAEKEPRELLTDAEPDYARQVEVRQAFAALDEEERMILAFSIFGGYRSEEIGEMLDKSAATVRSRKSRALEKLRAVLGEE